MESTKKGKVIICNIREKYRPENAVIINVTSKSADKVARELSPFHLGPVTVTPFDDKIECKKMENAWQYSKVYAGYEDKNTWLQWASKGFESDKANRFPFGKAGKKTMKLVYFWHKNQQLSYIEARKQIYCVQYAAAAEKYAAEALERLRNLYDSGKTICLLDFDGSSKRQDLKQVLNDSNKALAHAYLIAMLIKNERYWEEK